MNLNLTPYIKTNAQWIIYVNVTSKIIKILGNNIRQYIHDFETMEVLLYITWKSLNKTYEKTDKLYYIKIKDSFNENLLWNLKRQNRKIRHAICKT